MYIDNIEGENFRTFRKARIEFVHPDQNYGPRGLQIRKPRIKNVNLLLGDNGSGKTTLLKAIAIACLGPAVEDANLPVYRLIRHEPSNAGTTSIEAVIAATFTPHAQDGHGTTYLPGRLESRATISLRGEGPLQSLNGLNGRCTGLMLTRYYSQIFLV